MGDASLGLHSQLHQAVDPELLGKDFKVLGEEESADFGQLSRSSDSLLELQLCHRLDKEMEITHSSQVKECQSELQSHFSAHFSSSEKGAALKQREN